MFHIKHGLFLCKPVCFKDIIFEENKGLMHHNAFLQLCAICCFDELCFKSHS